MPNNVKDFGAVGDGVADDRQAIQAAIDDAVASDKGGIVFPSGTYRVSRVAVPGGRWSLDLNGVQDFMVLGEGSCHRRQPHRADRPGEQSHGVVVESGTEDLVIDRCIMRECFGDGVRLVGTDQAGKLVRRLRIENCLFQTNKRSGLGIQRAIEQIIVANCHFDATVTDQSIDFEPTGSGGPIPTRPTP